MKKLLFSALALTLTFASFAQINTPSPSPGAEISQSVGLTKIMVEYARPAMKGRTIFADKGLVPFGEIWRTGANSATKITLGEDMSLGGVEMKGGDYAVLTRPNAKEWTFMFYPYESSSWNSYTEQEPAAKVSVMVTKSGASVESFTIGVNNVTESTATLDFSWENTLVSIPVKVSVHEKVMADIKRIMAGPSANDYYAAASYLNTSGTDNKLALEYIQKANETKEPRFWMVRREALILADLGRKAEAIEAAKRSMALAKEAGNMDYVRMNENSIAEWSK
ncbi:MAG: dihydrolipoamide dehydrogenase [Bacteroidetes bacterium]|nr:MAG: dihydrolipoamide dehydrogenase [Bacteroidota bacterium]PTM08275.1 MAG: dihydrolipoamide dehydrogenase [Bacteroidota bacterium]